MINGLGVLGWGVGGIEAEAAMLGQPVSMLIPQVVGFKLTGALPEGATATDLVLTVTQMLRKKGVVGKFVEFFGDGLAHAAARRPRDDRATWRPSTARRAASSRSTPRRSRYLRFTGPRRGAGRSSSRRTARSRGSSTRRARPRRRTPTCCTLDLAIVEPSLAGPTRPQDRVTLAESKTSFHAALEKLLAKSPKPSAPDAPARRPTIDGKDVELDARLGRHRGDHELHEHVEPDRAGRGGPAREEGGREGPRRASRG